MRTTTTLLLASLTLLAGCAATRDAQKLHWVKTYAGDGQTVERTVLSFNPGIGSVHLVSVGVPVEGVDEFFFAEEPDTESWRLTWGAPGMTTNLHTIQVTPTRVGPMGGRCTLRGVANGGQAQDWEGEYPLRVDIEADGSFEVKPQE